MFNENSGLKGAEAPKKSTAKVTNDKVKFDQNEFDNFVKEIQFLVEKKPNIDDFMDGDSTDSSSMDNYGSEEEFDDDFGGLQPGQEKECSIDQSVFLKSLLFDDQSICFQHFKLSIWFSILVPILQPMVILVSYSYLIIIIINAGIIWI